METTTKQPTENSQQTANAGSQGDERVRGITKLLAVGDRPKPYGVQWRVDGVRKTEFFAEEGARDKRFLALAADKKKGALHHALTKQEVAEYRAMKSTFGQADWHEIYNGYVAYSTITTGQTPNQSLTVKDACSQYLEEQEKRLALHKVSEDTMRHKRTKLRRFAEAFGANQLASVPAVRIVEWLEDDLDLSNGTTFDSWLAHIRAMFSYFVRTKKIRDNPCEEIEKRGTATEYVNILSVRDTAKLFQYALQHKKVAIGRLALEAFAGIRFGSATRLEKNDINFVDHGINLPAHKLKTGMTDGRRHYIDGLPDNLWEWLAIATEDTWSLTGSEWMHIKTEVFTKAKVPHPKNCLRHSFATYHLAMRKNPGETATILW